MGPPESILSEENNLKPWLGAVCKAPAHGNRCRKRGHGLNFRGSVISWVFFFPASIFMVVTTILFVQLQMLKSNANHLRTLTTRISPVALNGH